MVLVKDFLKLCKLNVRICIRRLDVIHFNEKFKPLRFYCYDELKAIMDYNIETIDEDIDGLCIEVDNPNRDKSERIGSYIVD